jgi:hypothetical protein
MGVAPRIIFSGHSALMAEGEPVITEAEAMATYARSRGLPAKAVLLEELSRDTVGNAYFVRKHWLDPNGWKSIRVVTTDYHIPRAAWIFRKILGPDYDVAFSATPSDRFAASVAFRAREESDIAAFLAEWLGPIADGDFAAVTRLIEHEHPGYAATPTMSKAELRARVEAITRARRVVEHGPSIRPPLEERLADL